MAIVLVGVIPVNAIIPLHANIPDHAILLAVIYVMVIVVVSPTLSSGCCSSWSRSSSMTAYR